MLHQVFITAWSLWYLKPSMIFWRVYRTIKGAIIRIVERAGLAERFFRRAEGRIDCSSFPVLSGRYHCEKIDLAARNVSFLNDELTLPADPTTWRAAAETKPLLWQFHFGYHDYLLALLSRDDADDAILDTAIRFALDWDEAFALHLPGARRSAWHPYVLSIRTESWVRLHGIVIAHGWSGDDARLSALPGGVEQMTAVLLRNLEKGTMANHLLRNIKALVFAGLFLDTDTGASARRIGMRLLERELREQILDDGCHFERSPMYHVSMLNDVLDMAEAMLLSGSTVPESLASAILRMTDFLRRMRHPDGEIPMFNDSTRSFFLRTDEVLARGTALCAELEVEAPRPAASDSDPRRISGLLIAETPRLWLVFDAGLVGPDYQPGHAHCDTLSFELSVDGRRFISDTGVFHYKESPERTYSRSTAAHSTIEIDGREQSEVWKSFRVGRRAKIRHMSRTVQDGLIILRGMHDGYTRYGKGLLHERAVVVGTDWILVADWLHGSGCHRWSSRVHLHPGVEASAAEAGLRLRNGETTACVTTFGNTALRVEETDMYPAFGERAARNSIVLEGAGDFPMLTGFMLSFGEDVPVLTFPESATGELRIGPLTVKSVLHR
ncbi:MAG: heparinase II/III family protein [Bacteroidia bacterium]|nr:heparinase II/III family protein [Bacteroidia bacterium]